MQTHNDATIIFHIDLAIPFVLAYVIDLYASGRVCIKDLRDEVPALRAHEGRDLIISVQDFFIQEICIGILEGQEATDHREEDDATAPDICHQTMIALSGNHLRGRIAGAPASCLKGLPVLIGVAEAEINDFNIIMIIHEQILWLQISVADPKLMKVFDARYYLVEEPSGLLLS